MDKTTSGRSRHVPVLLTALLIGFTTIATAPAALAGGPRGELPEIAPRSETAPLFDDEDGGNADADDPAIWRDQADPGRSLVIVTAKEAGLRVYDLDAREVQSVPAPPAPGPDDAPGRFNNVDLVNGLRLSSGPADVAVTSDRGGDRLRFYSIDRDRPGGPLTDVTDPAAPRIFTASQEEANEESTAYGLATWTDRSTGRSYALVSQAARTTVALLELSPTPDGTIGYRKVRSIALPGTFRLPDGTSWTPCADPGEEPQVEGMVVDPETGTLYAGQEDVGIWRVRADLTDTPSLQDKTREYGIPATYNAETDECDPGADPGFGGERLSADVEGLTILPQEHGAGYLLAASQGDNTFAAYKRQGFAHKYEGGFRITAASETLDGSEECDGAAVLNAPLGKKYPHGLLVVQDGAVTPEGGDREATGFKFVDLRDVLSALGD